MRLSRLIARRTTGAEARSPTSIVAAGIVSLIAYVSLQVLSSERPLRYSDEMIEAATIMRRATVATRQFCDSTGIEIDEVFDPNRTCLIGPEYTGLMTTLGHLDAKRTTTDPAMASLIVHLLGQIGVAEGDTIAVGSSASFPALLVATLAAAKAMGAHPVVIMSLGASTYGATNPRFNLLNMYTLLLRASVFATPPAAISLGGDEDIGREFDPDLKNDLLRQIEASGTPFISEPDLRINVATRMAVYDGESPEGRISAFVNAGGSYANLGTSALALQLDPGLNDHIALPAESERGVLFEMAAREIPVIHLLFIRGLALRHGVTWDPIPLREPGKMVLHADRPRNHAAVWLVGAPFFLVISILVFVFSKSAKRQQQTDPGALL